MHNALSSYCLVEVDLKAVGTMSIACLKVSATRYHRRDDRLLCHRHLNRMPMDPRLDRRLDRLDRRRLSRGRRLDRLDRRHAPRA